MKNDLIDIISRAISFRESKIRGDWDFKNQTYVERLNDVLEYVEALPEDHPLLEERSDLWKTVELDIGEFANVFDPDWTSLIHCDATDPASWLRRWLGTPRKEEDKP